jgi:hypothetical protein
MRTAVVRVNLDPAGAATTGRLDLVVERLRADGVEVRAGDLRRLPAEAREIELIVPGEQPEELRRWAEQACAGAGADGPRAAAVNFVSRGTDEDALGVVRAFGITAEVERYYREDDTESADGQGESAVFTITREDAGRIVESRLQTALEAALNCEVRIVVAGEASAPGNPVGRAGVAR